MTARDTSSGSRKKASRHDRDASTLLEYIRAQRRVSLERLATRSGLTERRTRRLLIDLQERNLVEVTPGLRAVWVAAVDPADSLDGHPDGGDVVTADEGPHQGGDGTVVETDGGAVQRLVHALTGESETINLTEDELFGCLASARRRRIIRYTAAFYEEHARHYIEAKTVANALADRMQEQPAPEAARDDSTRHRHYVSLTQVHAPELDQLGLIEYHPRVKKLRATADGVAVASVLTEIAGLCAGEHSEEQSAQDDQEDHYS